MTEPWCPGDCIEGRFRGHHVPEPTDLLGRLQRKSLVPLNAMLVLTRRCNLRCPHCFERSDADCDELTIEEIRQLFSQMAQAGTLNLIVSGGEPTVRPDYLQVLMAAAREHFGITLKTSATQLDTAAVKRVFDSGVAKLDVSLYSTCPDEHDGFVGLKGAYHRTLNAVQVFRDAGGKSRVSIICMNWNVNRVRAMMDLCDEMGVRYAVDTQLYVGPGGDSGQQQLQILEQGLADVFRDPRMNVLQLMEGASPRGMDERVCGGGLNGVCVRPDGEVWPCNVLPLSMGNVRTTPYVDIVTRSSVLDRMSQIVWGGNAACPECQWSAVCSRCPGNAFNECGDMNAISQVGCMIARLKATVRVGKASDVKGGDANED